MHSQCTITINLWSRYCQKQAPNRKNSQIWQCSVRSMIVEVCACDSCNTKIILTWTSSLAGYWKWTPSNWISPLSPGSFFPVLLRLSISGTRSSTEKMAAAEPLATANASRCGVVRPMFIAPDSTPNKTYVHDNIQSCIIRLWSMKWKCMDKPDNIVVCFLLGNYPASGV